MRPCSGVRMPDFSSEITVKLIDSMGDDARIASAARVSTKGLDGDGGKGAGLVRALMREGHTSPFEHSVMTVSVEAPIFVAREWMRHRTQSYSEISARYTTLQPKFYRPNVDRPIVQTGKALDYHREEGTIRQVVVTEHRHKWTEEEAWKNYESMLAEDVANEVARNVLPVSIYTQFWATANLGNWFKFLTLRDAPNALFEIRQAAQQVDAIIEELWPIAHSAYRERREGRSI
jgi:thymidylate synthase (FAD)